MIPGEFCSKPGGNNEGSLYYLLLKLLQINRNIAVVTVISVSTSVDKINVNILILTCFLVVKYNNVFIDILQDFKCAVCYFCSQLKLPSFNLY